MFLTRERVAAIAADHDSTSGFAGQLCPVCQVMRPCQTWILATDLLEQLDRTAVLR